MLVVDEGIEYTEKCGTSKSKNMGKTGVSCQSQGAWHICVIIYKYVISSADTLKTRYTIYNLKSVYARNIKFSHLYNRQIA